MQKKEKGNIKNRARCVAKNCAVMIGIFGVATGLCFLLQRFVTTNHHVPLLFVLAVLFISRLTDGYLYGILASMIAVVGVNYVFTYPYFALNFTITGYPVTFIAMLAVALIVSTLTTQIQEQEQLRLEAEKEKMRGNLLRAVSHDIRTPLTSIVGAASGLLDHYDVLEEARKRELLGDIREEAQWLIRIVENLLSVTRINGDRMQIHTSEEVVEEVIGDAVVKFRKRFGQIKVETKLPDEVLMAPMDGILIGQVLINLMENSVLHGKTTTCITVRVWREENQLAFCVEDDGQGIREEVLPVMFEGNLQHIEGKESDAKRNMGIGLSVCMSIIRAHRGTMLARNRAEGGACVLFYIPATEEDAETFGSRERHGY